MDISFFGKNLRNLRLELNMSQAKFAQILDVSQSQISKLECGKTEPTVNIAFAIVRKFDISWEELFDGIE
ncbi:MAG: helix-turn-helix transcriptional regulator [Clostridiales bacterium]|nr:helix-turn-helix transcriptional regulator [Clostridiales bacterium]